MIFTISFIFIDEMIEQNDPSSDKLYIATFKFTRLYNAFNNNENNRVIKSYNHRKKIFGNVSSYEEDY